MLFSLQELLHRNHKYSIQLFFIMIQSPSFCIAFFHHKKILFSFYYICYLLENETLAQELFGGSLDEVLGTDDDNPKVDFDVIAWEVFGASIQEIIDIESKVITCDDTMHDWDAAAEDILENIQGDKKKNKKSQMMMRETRTHLIQSFQISLLLLSTLALLKSLLIITECQCCCY